MQFLGTLTNRFQTVVTTVDTFTYDYTQDYATAVLIFTTTTTADVPTAATFNGVAMTLQTTFNAASGRSFVLFTYAPPSNLPTGTYTIAVTMTGTGKSLDAWVGEYAGVKNDFSSRSQNSRVWSGTSHPFQHTTVANDSWIVGFGRFTAAFKTFNGSSDGVLRSPTAFSRAWVDSGASEGAADAKSINATSASSAGGSIDYLTVELKREDSFTLGVTESATTADGIGSRAGTRNIQESETFLDVGRRVLARALAELGTFSDTLFAQVLKIFTETSTITDTLYRLITRAPRETFTATERITRALTVRFSELSSFVDTGRLSGVWIPRTPPNTSWSDASPPSSSWTDRTEPSSSFTPRTPPSSSWTDRTPPSTTWS